MKIPAPELALRMQHFETICRQSGIKITHQRMEIFREVAQTIDHPDAEQVFQRVRKRIPTVSLDTVYRTLWLLKDLGLITTIGTSRERTRFDANLESHHHFTCSSCGFTRDFSSDQLNRIPLPEAIDQFGDILATHVEVRGICRQCLENEKSQKTRNIEHQAES